MVPVIYDDTNEHRILTQRLIVLMKKTMRVLGDIPKHLAVDGSQYYDLEDPEDCPIPWIEDLGLEVEEIERLHRHAGDTCPEPGGRNRFCVMTGEAGKVVIGAYPAAYNEHEGPEACPVDRPSRQIG